MRFLTTVVSGLPVLGFYLAWCEKIQVHMHERVRLFKLKRIHHRSPTYPSAVSVQQWQGHRRKKKEAKSFTALTVTFAHASLDKQ